MARDVFIPNSVTIFGTIEEKRENEKAVTITINTGDAYPRIVIFNSAKKFADKVYEGDFVKAECTVQEVKGTNRTLGPRTIACNRISVVDDREPFAKFSVFGRPISVNKVDDTEAFAIVKVVSANGKNNYLRVNFYGTEDEVDEFMELGPNKFVNFRGNICTSSMRTNYRDELCVETYRNVRPR